MSLRLSITKYIYACYIKATLIATVTLSLVVEAQSTPPATGHCLPGWEHFGAYCYYNDVYGVSTIYFTLKKNIDSLNSFIQLLW